jgi:hypothetical protein
MVLTRTQQTVTKRMLDMVGTTGMMLLLHHALW